MYSRIVLLNLYTCILGYFIHILIEVLDRFSVEFVKERKEVESPLQLETEE